jgi:hypothetical protein
MQYLSSVGRRLYQLTTSAVKLSFGQPLYTISSRSTVRHMATSEVQQVGNFDLIKQIKLDYTDVVVSKWRSRITGLSVVHLDYEGRILTMLYETQMIDSS